MKNFDGDAQRDALKRLVISDAMLMDRLTYEALPAVGPLRTGLFADLINETPKYVFSSTLPRLSWQNASVVKGDPITATRELKAVGVGDLTIFGFGQLARALFGGSP